MNVGETFTTWRDATMKKRIVMRRYKKSRTRRFETKNKRVGESKKWEC